MPAATKKKTGKTIIGFIACDRYHEEGKFCATADEAQEWISKDYAGGAFDDIDDYHVYAVAQDGTIKCCNLNAIIKSVSIKPPTGWKILP